jgi:hypothetical protein
MLVRAVDEISARTGRLTQPSARTDTATSASVQRLLAALLERADRPSKRAIHRQPVHRDHHA